MSKAWCGTTIACTSTLQTSFQTRLLDICQLRSVESSLWAILERYCPICGEEWAAPTYLEARQRYSCPQNVCQARYNE